MSDNSKLLPLYRRTMIPALPRNNALGGHGPGQANINLLAIIHGMWKGCSYNDIVIQQLWHFYWTNHGWLACLASWLLLLLCSFDSSGTNGLKWMNGSGWVLCGWWQQCHYQSKSAINLRFISMPWNLSRFHPSSPVDEMVSGCGTYSIQSTHTVGVC